MQGRKGCLEEGKEKGDMMLIWYNLKIIILKVCRNSIDRRIDLFLHFFHLYSLLVLEYISIYS